MVSDTYADYRDDNLYVGKTRVTVETVIVSWQQGQTPEQIQEDFPTVSLAQVYGTIAYYLSHKDEVDAFFAETERKFAAFMAEQEAKYPDFYARQRALFTNLTEQQAADAGDPIADEAATRVESRAQKVHFAFSLTRTSISIL